MQRALVDIHRQMRRKPAAPPTNWRKAPMGLSNGFTVWFDIHQGFLLLGAIFTLLGFLSRKVVLMD